MLAGYSRVLVAVALCIATIAVHVGVFERSAFVADSVSLISRKLSLQYDMTTHESLRTVNGVIPEVSCPLG